MTKEKKFVKSLKRVRKVLEEEGFSFNVEMVGGNYFESEDLGCTQMGELQGYKKSLNIMVVLTD